MTHNCNVIECNAELGRFIVQMSTVVRAGSLPFLAKPLTCRPPYRSVSRSCERDSPQPQPERLQVQGIDRRVLSMPESNTLVHAAPVVARGQPTLQCDGTQECLGRR